jgi:hypothetical protein
LHRGAASIVACLCKRDWRWNRADRRFTWEAAECMGVSGSTADRGWRYARAWLYAMADGDSEKKVPPA